MNKYNTLFGQLLSLIKRAEFNRLCKNTMQTNTVNKSQLSYAENTRGSGVYEDLYYNLISNLEKGERKAAGQKLYAVDATTI